MARNGFFSTALRSAVPSTARTSTSSITRTVRVRGWPVSAVISPKWAGARRTAVDPPRVSASTAPETMT